MRNNQARLAVRPIALVTASLFSAMTGSSVLAQDRVLEEVIVTAQKKAESVQDIPSTINAISGDTLDQFQVLNFNDVAALTPGLQLDTVDGRRATITLRGVQADPDNIAATPINVYWNEAPIRTNVAFQPTYDLERMEVLRGPQGTLQGRTSPAGQINIFTRRANVSQPDGYVRQTFQDNATSNTQFGASLPIIQDKLGIRLAGLYEDSEGQQAKNLNTGQKDSGLNKAGRITLDWFATDTFEASLVYDYREANRVALETLNGSDMLSGVSAGGFLNYGILGFGGPIDKEDRYATATRPYNNFERQQLVTLSMDWDLGGHTLTSVSGYQNTMNNGELDAVKVSYGLGIFGGPPDPATNFSTGQNVVGQNYIFSQEFRLVKNDADFWDYTIGLYYDRSWARTQAIVDYPDVAAINPNQAFCGLGITPCQGISDIPITQELTAVFMHNTLNFTDNTNLQFGLRYQHNSLRSRVDNYFNGVYAGDALEFQDSTSKSAITGSLKLSHFFDNGIMVYGSYDRGYRPPGITITPSLVPGDILPFDEETSDSIEFGFKSTLADGTFRLNGAVFYQKYKGFQARADDIDFKNAGGETEKILGGLTYNADSTLQGAEIEFTHLLGQRFTWGGGVSYTDHRFNDDEVAPCNDDAQLATLPPGSISVCDASGRLVAPAPYWSTTLNADYFVPVGSAEWYVRGLFTWQSQTINELVDGKNIPDYGVFNLYTGFRGADGSWDVSLWAKNLTNTQQQKLLRNNERFNGLDTGYEVAPMINQRVIGLTAQYNWGL